MSDSTREALAEISERARGIVEELARHTRGSRSEPPGPEASRPSAGQSRRREGGANEAPEQTPLPELHHRLNELRACIGEVADVLEATVERLETIEIQLGDPEAGIERQLAEGIVRCERLLMGIEHRVVTTARSEVPSEVERRDDLPDVLVVADSSRRRAGLCLALERQGLRALAAADLSLAVKVAARSMPAVALVDMGSCHEDGEALLEDWKEHEEQGTLPCAVLLDFRDGTASAARGFETIKEAHGEAAMAASLTRVARDSARRKSGEWK